MHSSNQPDTAFSDEGASGVELLGLQVLRNEVAVEEAENRAASLAVAGGLPHAVAEGLASQVVQLATAGVSREAVVLARLVVAGADALPASPDADAIRELSALALVDAAHIALQGAPDGDLLRRAREAGERAIATARDRRDAPALASALFAVGSMLLDPYTAGRPLDAYSEWASEWVDSDGLDPTDGRPRMPSAEDALSDAEEKLRQAEEIASGQMRGLARKALVQAGIYRELLGQEIDREQMSGLARSGLEDLPADTLPQARVGMLAMMDYCGASLGPAELDWIRAQSLDEIERRQGLLVAVDFVQQAAGLLGDTNPALALDVLRDAAPLLRRADPAARLRALTAERKALIAAYAAAVPQLDPAEDLTTTAKTLLSTARAERWDARQVSASLIALAGRSEQVDGEADGLDLLSAAQRLAPVLTEGHSEALQLLAGDLLVGLGVNGVTAEDWDLAVDGYGRALAHFLDLDVESRALDVLTRIDDVAQRSDPSAGLKLIMATAPVAARLELRLGPQASDLVQRTLRRSIAGLTSQQAPLDALLVSWQAAKGLRFATNLTSGVAYQRQADPDGQRLLQEIAAAEQEAAAAGVPIDAVAAGRDPREILLDEESLLASYSDQHERLPGHTAAERAVNLQIAFDAHLSEQLLQGTEGSAPWLTLDGIQAALDDRTVLLSYYVGATEDGRTAVYLLGATADDVALTVVPHDFPAGVIEMEHGGRKIRMDPIAPLVEDLRRAVKERPLGRQVVTAEAAETLATHGEGMLGHLAARLDDWRAAGKDHLCFVPHGALHYYPLHLLGRPGQTLAERFTVTYLPNLHLLVSNRGRPRVRRRREPLVAIGLGFENDPRPLAPLAQAVPEARDVAALLGSTALVDDEATESAVVAALQRSRFVHLSTHGRHNAVAPAFQCVYLQPDAQSDGILAAHELLDLDLRGIDLLTLSACETALGRFDVSDNLRGLPASFLLAGVTALVGTLWEVSQETSRRFFTTLYARIAEGYASIDAFAAAQAATRETMPQYVDWGAFYFAGDWRSE